MKRFLWGVLGVVLLLGFAAILFVFGPAGRSTDPNALASGAQTACHRSVSKWLKAPATARWDRDSEDSFLVQPGEWKVTGQVDASNAFGVPIRAHWTCRVQREANGEASVSGELLP